jgi:hypothetical protein
MTYEKENLGYLITLLHVAIKVAEGVYYLYHVQSIS